MRSSRSAIRHDLIRDLRTARLDKVLTGNVTMLNLTLFLFLLNNKLIKIKNKLIAKKKGSASQSPYRAGETRIGRVVAADLWSF